MIIGILGTLLVIAVLFAAQGIYRNWDVYRGRSKTFDGLPTHLDEQGEIQNAFPDDSQYGGRLGNLFKEFNKVTKPWHVFSTRSKYSWARWRVPVDLFKINDGSKWRIETVEGRRYTSRIQYWSRWHVLVQWPLNVSFHIYWRKADVPPMGERPTDFGIKKLLFGYFISHFDQDNIHWFLSAAITGEHK